MALDINALWVILSSFLVFTMQAGFLALEAGMTRAKNNIDVAMKNIIDFTISSVAYWLIGFPIMFGLTYFGQLILVPDLSSDTDLMLMFLFQVMFCGTTVTIISGAIAERTRFDGYVFITVLISAIIYPVFGQWVWSITADGSAVGWLAQLGFYDFAGSTVVHSLGGWSALAIVLIVGARTGRFAADGKAVSIPKSNLPFVILGVLLLWFGWFGFNGGSLLAFNSETLTVLFNTMMGGSFGGVAGFILTFILKRRGDTELILNGVLAGLVAITAGATVLDGAGIVITASIGTVVMVATQKLLDLLQIDDAVGAIPVHLGAGIWGTLAVGLFGNLTLLDSGLSRPGQILVQLAGIVVCGAWTFVSVYGVMALVNRVMALRVSPEDEHIGLNISEHGARSDMLDLLDVMQEQALTRDLSIRAPVEPFTQLGRVANYYNLVIESLEDAQAALLASNTTLENKVEETSKVNRKLSMANEQIKSFANILSHDLRTPITSVRALVEEIQFELTEIQSLIINNDEATHHNKDAVEEFIPESLRLIDSAIEQMDLLTKQILIVAKEESRPYQPVHLEMQPFVQQLVDAQRGVIAEKGINITVNNLPDIVADEVMVQQIFSNLISNAIKYLDPDRPGNVTISGEETVTETIFSIADNGLGIPESQYDRVFELFRRVGKHSQIEGNGFGLFYIRNMIQRYDGNIWFESQEGIGTTFYVSLPKQSILQLSDNEVGLSI